MVSVTETNRGFALIYFKDRYGSKCSLQKSSMASEPAIWLGIDSQLRMHLTQEQVREIIPHLNKFAETGKL